MFDRYVIFSDELGVYLGAAFGLGFWSKLDPAGQTRCCVFESVDQARGHIGSWPDPPVTDFQVRPVQTAGADFATVAECVGAGLPGWEVSLEAV